MPPCVGSQVPRTYQPNYDVQDKILRNATVASIEVIGSRVGVAIDDVASHAFQWLVGVVVRHLPSLSPLTGGTRTPDMSPPYGDATGHNKRCGTGSDQLLAVGRWFPPGTPVSSTRKLISSSFHRLDITLAVAEALSPNKPKQAQKYVQY